MKEAKIQVQSSKLCRMQPRPFAQKLKPEASVATQVRHPSQGFCTRMLPCCQDRLKAEKKRLEAEKKRLEAEKKAKERAARKASAAAEREARAARAKTKEPPKAAAKAKAKALPKAKVKAKAKPKAAAKEARSLSRGSPFQGVSEDVASLRSGLRNEDAQAQVCGLQIACSVLMPWQGSGIAELQPSCRTNEGSIKTSSQSPRAQDPKPRESELPTPQLPSKSRLKCCMLVLTSKLCAQPMQASSTSAKSSKWPLKA